MAKYIKILKTFNYDGCNLFQIEDIVHNGKKYEWAVISKNILEGNGKIMQEYWRFFTTKKLAEQYIRLVEMGENNFCFSE